ncbi:MAG: TlpA family protein disulfide reductase [Bacteroidales bacterium]|nr:TlpA family protein disulfide reductase [Clostridium sp.]MCM1204516.1 TlpA family protein disulfide reductase [Bacteroidales bacterium]
MKKTEWIKKVGTLLALSVFLTLAGCGAADGREGSNTVSSDSGQNEQDDYPEVLEGDKAPDFTAALADGGTFQISACSGKVVLLNFWATWCSPCVGEMPAFEKLHQEYGEDVAVLAVNSMEDKDTVNQFISDNGFTFPIAYDEQGEISRKYPTDGIPYTLVIGRDGTVQEIYLGAKDADAQYEEYKAAVTAALEEE